MMMLLFHLNVENNTLTELVKVQVDATTLKTDLKQRQWMKHSLTINATGHKMMLQFTGIINDKSQFIGLDDISFTPGACDQPPKYKQGFPCVDNPKTNTDFVNFSQVIIVTLNCP